MRAVTTVLAVAATAGVLIPLAVLRAGPGAPENHPSPSKPPQQVVVPRLHLHPDAVGGQPVTAVVAGNGIVAYGTGSGGVYLASAQTRPRRITSLAGRVEGLAFDSTGRWLAATSTRMQLAVVDMRHPHAPVTRRRIQTESPLGTGTAPGPLAIDTTGSRIAVQTDSIGVYSTVHSGPPRWLSGTYECSGPGDLAFVGSELIAASNSCASVWDATTLKVERHVHYPGTGNSVIGHGRILYGTFSHAVLMDYRTVSPLPSAPVAPGQPKPTRGRIIVDKTIGIRRSPIQPVADDGRIAAVLQDSRLIFWATDTRRILAEIPLPLTPPCIAAAKKGQPTQFRTSFSPDLKTLAVTAYCIPADSGSDPEEARRLTSYRHWTLPYPAVRQG
jgi:hypothetical protein